MSEMNGILDFEGFAGLASRDFENVWAGHKNFDDVWADLRHELKECKLEGVLVLRSKLMPGYDNLRGSKLVSKRPVMPTMVEVDEKYELTMSLDMVGRELLEHKVLGPGIYLLKFEGYFGPYYTIGLAPDWNPNYKRPTLNFSDVEVAVSDRKPEKNDSYKCTVIKKRADNSTALEEKTCKLSENVRNLGVNSALCQLETGSFLLVTWSHQQEKK